MAIYPTVKAGDLLAIGANLTGRDESALTAVETKRLLRWLDAELVEAWKWKDWSLLCTLEEVFYRPEWAAGSYAEDDEVYHAGKYWVALQATTEEPSVDVADDWEAFDPDPKLLDVDLVGDGSVYKLWRAFANEPEHVDDKRGIELMTTREGVQVVDALASSSVWLWYVTPPPSLAASQINDDATSYPAGTVVYDVASGEVRVAPGGEVWPTDYVLQEVPSFLRQWLEYGVAWRWLAFDRKYEMGGQAKAEREAGKSMAWNEDELLRRRY